MVYWNDDKFFTGLPTLSAKEIRGSNALRIPKKDKMVLKVHMLKFR